MENNSDRMGFALIALSVVAFVLLAVNGTLKASADGLFKGFKSWQESTFSQILNKEGDPSTDSGNVKGTEDSSYVYAQIRGGDRPLYARAAKIAGGLKIDRLGITPMSRPSDYSDISTADGVLTLPTFINGQNVIELGEYLAANTKFSSVVLPGKLQTIDNSSLSSTFTGTITLPDTLTSIGSDAFATSKFSGTLTLPPHLVSIGKNAFAASNFTGSLALPDSVTSVGMYAFQSSAFSGTLTLSKNLVSIDNWTFNSSHFDKVVNDNGTPTIGPYAIQMSTRYTYYKR